METETNASLEYNQKIYYYLFDKWKHYNNDERSSIPRHDTDKLKTMKFSPLDLLYIYREIVPLLSYRDWLI